MESYFNGYFRVISSFCMYLPPDECIILFTTKAKLITKKAWRTRLFNR